jgi:competence protein ComFC
MITQFKYNHALWMQPFLVELLVSAVEAHYPGEAFDALCAVPLHAVKRRERGFNQSSLLAVALARRLRIPLQGRRTLRRVRLTPSQTRLTARQRMTNVLGAFEAAKPAEWAGKRILLLDDVMTTGATVGACAKALTDAGAASVDVITVARGI